MISLLVKLSTVLKPFHKFTYLLALLIIANLAYQLLFSSLPAHPNNKELMFSLLALIWLMLINLMLQVFTQMPESKKKAESIFARIKNKLHQLLYYLLFLLFMFLTIVLIILSFKMFGI